MYNDMYNDVVQFGSRSLGPAPRSVAVDPPNWRILVGVSLKLLELKGSNKIHLLLQ